MEGKGREAGEKERGGRVQGNAELAGFSGFVVQADAGLVDLQGWEERWCGMRGHRGLMMWGLAAVRCQSMYGVVLRRRRPGEKRWRE